MLPTSFEIDASIEVLDRSFGSKVEQSLLFTNISMNGGMGITLVEHVVVGIAISCIYVLVHVVLFIQILVIGDVYMYSMPYLGLV